MKEVIDIVCYITPIRRLYQVADRDLATLELRLAERLFSHRTAFLSLFQDRRAQAAIAAFEAAGGLVRIKEQNVSNFENEYWRRENGIYECVVRS